MSGGFRDWVKNLGYRFSAIRYLMTRDALDVPDNISDEEIERMVERLFDQKDRGFNFDRLKLVGIRAVPRLIEALESPRLSSTKFSKVRHVADAKSPFERIVDLLAPFGPAEAARPISRYIQHEDDHFRKYAAIALGNIGTLECIEPMVMALNDEDDYVRSYAMMGIQRGMEAKRCSRDFLSGVFPGLTKLLSRADTSVSGEAPELLLAIDPERARSVLLSPEYFTFENTKVHSIIRALNRGGCKIPHDILLPFLKAVRPKIVNYPHDYNYSEALLAYAQNPDDSAEDTFRNELTSPSKLVQKAAAEALAIYLKLSNVQRHVFDALERNGIDNLSQPQRLYYAVVVYNHEVCNGGHAQYFANSSGDNWKLAIEGLSEIGASKRAAILQRAVANFGSSGASENSSERCRQIAAFTKQQDRLTEELDRQYYSCNENVEALLALYAIENKSCFTSMD